MRPIYSRFRITTIETFNIIRSIDAEIAEKFKRAIMYNKQTSTSMDAFPRNFGNTYPFKRLCVRIKQQNLQKYFSMDEGLTYDGIDKYLDVTEKLAFYVFTEHISINVKHKMLSRRLEEAIDDIRSESDNPEEITLCNMLMYRNRIAYEDQRDRNFTITKNAEMTYCPKGKETKMSDDAWAKTNRQQIKYGKGLLKILDECGYRFAESTIEKLVNSLKARYTFNATFKVVSGSDITKYYHYSSYAQNTASLGNSCMRHSSCQEYFRVYEKNVKMLIALDTNEKIVGRAILWDKVIIDENEEIMLMDRVYGNDMTIQAFKEWAKQNGYHHKAFQSYSDNYTITSPQGSNRDVKMHVEISGGPYAYMPYMDTFKYTDDRDSSDFELNNHSGDYELTNTEGNQDDEDYVTLHDGDRVHQDDARYVDMYDEYYRDEEVVYSEDRGEYILYDEAVEIDGEYVFNEDTTYIEMYDDYVRNEDAIWSEYSNSYILKEESVACEATSKILRKEDAIEIDGKFYCPDSVPCES